MKKAAINIILFSTLLVVIAFSFQVHAEEYVKTINLENSVSLLHVTVLDAITYKPISNATVLIWDLSTFVAPKLGFGIYLTNENGECYISGEYLKVGHVYRLYAYKGDFRAKRLEYVPTRYGRDIVFEIEKPETIVLQLVPGALIELEGIPYIVQSVSPEERHMTLKVIETTSSNYSFIREYGSTQDAFFLGLSGKLVAVPANMPFKIEVKVWFPLIQTGHYLIESEVFYIDNNSLPFILPQETYLSNIKIADFSLRKGCSSSF